MSSGWKEYRAYLGIGVKQYQARLRAAAAPFRARARAAAAAPQDETEAYRRFNAWFMPVAFVVGAAFCYVAAILNADGALISAAGVERAFPPSEGRLAFYAKYDTRSLHAYTATLAASFVIVPAFILANAIGYWKTVVAPGSCRKVNAFTAVGLLAGLGGFAIFLMGVFIYAPHSLPARGAGILFWPVFPAMASGMVIFFAFVIFSAVVGIAKFFFGLRGDND